MAPTRKTFQYRLRPTAAQERLLLVTLEECRWLYNHFLAERKTAWEERHEQVGLYDQHASLPALKELRPSLRAVHSQVLQNVATRLHLAMRAFFRRVKAGEDPGYPRFRGKGRYDSFCFPQAPSGCHIIGDRLFLAKIGSVRVVLHRPLSGTPKTVGIRRSATGKWYVTFSCEWEPTRLPPSREHAGIDVGLEAFATLSTGERIENPRFFRREEQALARAQRKLSKEAKGTSQRKKRRKAVARIHERTRFRRRDFVHQHGRRVADRFQVVAVEALSVRHMVHNHGLAKSISDVAWAEFLAMTACKAEWAGRQFIAVFPAHTSQRCSRCGQCQKMPLSERRFRCPCCALEIHRDENAALNVLALGLQGLGLVPSSPRLSPWGAVTPRGRTYLSPVITLD